MPYPSAAHYSSEYSIEIARCQANIDVHTAATCLDKLQSKAHHESVVGGCVCFFTIFALFVAVFCVTVCG